MSLPWEFSATDPGVMVLTFTAPAEPLSINKAHTLHWAARRKRTDPWRDHTLVLARAARAAYSRTVEAWPVQAVDIAVELPFRTNARRDPHNYTGTVVKALVDGLVRGGLLPDDSPEWATIKDPTISIQPDKTKPLMATVTITPRSQT